MKEKVKTWHGAKPNIILKQDPTTGAWDYEIWYIESKLWSGSCSKHDTALSAAKRNRTWIMRAMLEGDSRFPRKA